jgi:1-acyl-sn-glycerol-3-phosphate acyltransferase
MAEPERNPLSVREGEEPSTAAGLPAVRRDELRRHLPGVEPERRLNDWGRSERVEGFFDRALVDFLYRYWFRAEVEGIENVPATGGALLVSNHAGALPPDGGMMAKIGCVPAHPANVDRLLYDEGQLVLVFPEGRKGTEKLYKDRYLLRRFGRGGFVEAAMRSRAPIVPVAVVGAEEAAPVFAQLGVLRRLTGLLYFPITPTFPHFGLLGMLGYLPAKFRIRFLAPFRFEEPGMHEDKALVQTVSHEVRARIQESLWEMLGKRKSVWFG